MASAKFGSDVEHNDSCQRLSKRSMTDFSEIRTQHRRCMTNACYGEQADNMLGKDPVAGFQIKRCAPKVSERQEQTVLLGVVKL